MAKPPRPGTGDFARLPDGEPVHVVIRSAEVEESPFKDEKNPDKKKYRVRMVMEAVDPELQGAKCWAFPGFSLHPKAPLRKIALACADRDLSDEELYEQFDTDNLKDVQLVIIGEYQDGQTDYLKPTIFKRLAKSKWVEVAPEGEAAGKAPEPDNDKDIDI